jgi:hypothetical protein
MNGKRNCEGGKEPNAENRQQKDRVMGKKKQKGNVDLGLLLVF